MAWIRLDDQIAHHPKILKCSDLACWLYVCCLGYAQKFLTNGFIPKRSLSTISHVSRPLRAIKQLVNAGLLEEVPDGWQIHDYLDFNESAQSVKRRREQDRIRKNSGRNRDGIGPDNTQNPSDPSRARASHPIPSVEDLSKNNKLIPTSVSTSPPAVKPTNGNGTHTHDERAVSFIELYGVLFTELRSGAHYHGRPSVDFQRALELVRAFDDARLEKLVRVFLKTDEEWIAKSNRSIPVFASRASWCDDRLRKVEAQKR